MRRRLQSCLYHPHIRFVVCGVFLFPILRWLQVMIWNFLDIPTLNTRKENPIIFTITLVLVTVLEYLCAHFTVLAKGKGVFYMTFFFVACSYASHTIYVDKPGMIPG